MTDDVSPDLAAVPPPAQPIALTSYVIGLVGFALGGGFYGILFCILMVAWALHAPSAPTATEGAAIFCAAFVHLIPLGLWLAFRASVLQLSPRLRAGIAVAAWLLIPASLAVMFATLGM